MSENKVNHGYDTSLLFKFPYLMACAGFGGCVAEMCSIPFDTIKVLKQVQMKSGGELKYKGTFQSMGLVLNENGVKALFTGITAGFHRQMMYASLRIALFYRMKEFMLENFSFDKKSILPRLFSGLFAGSFAICFGNPSEVVKVRYQSDLQVPKESRRYTKGIVDAYKQVFNGKNGFKEFFVGLPVNMVRNAIYNAAEVVTYDAVKEYIVSDLKLLDDGLRARIIASTCAGIAAVVFGSPFDVIKTRKMKHVDPNTPVYKVVMEAYNDKGFKAFYQGAAPQLVRLVSFNVICFLSFEEAKHFLLTNVPSSLKKQGNH